MKTTPKHNEKMAKMTFGSVYPYYLKKINKKGRTEEELMEVIEWLTGYNTSEIEKFKSNETSFEEFFNQAKLNPKAKNITGVICGYRIEEIENPITRKVRYLDKLVDDLAKGKSMDKILQK